MFLYNNSTTLYCGFLDVIFFCEIPLFLVNGFLNIILKGLLVQLTIN
jgi:hypothetical protein